MRIDFAECEEREMTKTENIFNRLDTIECFKCSLTDSNCPIYSYFLINNFPSEEFINKFFTKDQECVMRLEVNEVISYMEDTSWSI